MLLLDTASVMQSSAQASIPCNSGSYLLFRGSDCQAMVSEGRHPSKTQKLFLMHGHREIFCAPWREAMPIVDWGICCLWREGRLAVLLLVAMEVS